MDMIRPPDAAVPTPAEALAAPLSCIVCGRPEAVKVLFVPRDQRLAGGTAGTVRGARYSLCKRCNRKPGKRRAAERIILNDMAALQRVN
jgi:hypothetical protein